MAPAWMPQGKQGSHATGKAALDVVREQRGLHGLRHRISKRATSGTMWHDATITALTVVGVQCGLHGFRHTRCLWQLAALACRVL